MLEPIASEALLLHRAVTLLGLAALTGTSAVAAQGTPDSLTITYGQTVDGKLTPDDPKLQDGSFYRRYQFVGRVGDALTVWLNSSDFNANLLLADASDSLLVADDNAGGSCNAHIQTALPKTGVYTLFVNSAEPGEVGQYYLTLERGTLPPERQEPCTGWSGLEGAVSIGDSATATMTSTDRQLPNDSTYYQVWQLWNPGGVPFTVDVTAPFDGALVLVRGMTEVLTFDDDSGPGCNPRIAYAPENERPLRIIVDSRNKELGEYQLKVSNVLLPAVDQPPCLPNAN